MHFTGWTMDDFAVFDTDTFEGRMALIRARIQPRLEALGRDLSERLEAETGDPWFFHVARHMRRTVNPPDDTWVALNRVQRGYKATVHFGAGLSAQGANVCLVVKPECQERSTFAAALQEADRWRALYAEAEGLFIGDVPNAPLSDLLPAREALTQDWLRHADALRRKKAFEFEMGYRLDPETAAALSGPDFVEESLRRIRALLPLYRAGIAPPAAMRSE